MEWPPNQNSSRWFSKAYNKLDAFALTALVFGNFTFCRRESAKEALVI